VACGQASKDLGEEQDRENGDVTCARSTGLHPTATEAPQYTSHLNHKSNASALRIYERRSKCRAYGYEKKPAAATVASLEFIA
jgi:hypothetical protein